MADLKFTLDEEMVRTALQEALLTCLKPEERDELVKGAIEGTVWVAKVIDGTMQPGAFHVACPAPVSHDYPGVSHVPTALLTPDDEVHEGTTSLSSGRKL